MRLVADENCDSSLVIELRAAGSDVVPIIEQIARADDRKVIDFARSERRLVLTEDTDGEVRRLAHVQAPSFFSARAFLTMARCAPPD